MKPTMRGSTGSQGMILGAAVSFLVLATLAVAGLIVGNHQTGGAEGAANMPADKSAELGKSGVVLIDFWATWCYPCKLQAKIFEEHESEISQLAEVRKIDVDEHPELAKEYNVTGIPTLVILKDGKEAQRFVGTTEADELLPALKKAKG